MESGKILIIDDDPDILATARLLLKQEFSTVHTLQDPTLINPRVSSESYDAIVLDMNFRKGDQDGKGGLYWLERILQIDPDIVVILITAYGDLELAVQAIKMGASDFVLKPWKNEKLLEAIVKGLADKKNVPKSNQRIPVAGRGIITEKVEIVGQSAAMRHVFNQIRQVAPTDASVLVTGENGTGKDLVARALHLQSHRKARPFVAVDLGAISESLVESELFGHVKGAFTDANTDKTGWFEQANGGTLFFDEIANLSLPAQAKLLRALQTASITPVGSNEARSVNLRVIAATSKHLHQMVEHSLFRQDLLFRINTIVIDIPALKDRGNDINLLAQHFLLHYNQLYNKQVSFAEPAANLQLLHYRWPGNVRELQHAVERAVILNKGEWLTSGDVIPPKPNAEEPEPQTLSENEKMFIARKLRANGGNVSQTARELGITRAALYRRLGKHGL